jgi:hypothetical protein
MRCHSVGFGMANRTQSATQSATQSFGVGCYAISKKACGSGGVRVGERSAQSDKAAKRVGTLILIDAVWSGNFERGEIVSPVGCIASKVSV